MTAQIFGFVTREKAGLRRPRSVSRNITPASGGVAIHYGGGPQSAAAPGNTNHDACIHTWRSWQNYHMSKNYVDVAYTGAFCNHGYAFAGRGSGVRTGANGTNRGNQNFYAVVWIGGAGQTPTRQALDAADWWVDQLRRNGGAGSEVWPHRYFKSTGCPGDPLAEYAASRNGQAIPTTEKAPTTEPQPSQGGSSVVRKIQTGVEVVSDGKWGPNTDSRVMFMRTVCWAFRGWPSNRPYDFSEEQTKMAQRVIDTPDDGDFGPNSRRALDTWIRDFQERIGVKSDGYWGPNSDGKLLSLRRKHLNNY